MLDFNTRKEGTAIPHRPMLHIGRCTLAVTMDLTERKITKIAREASKLAVRTLKEDGIGTAEYDFIHLVRHHPGITQAEVREQLRVDKGAAARRAASLEAKGYLIRQANPKDGRSQLLFATEKAEGLRARLVLQVHDELIVECPQEETEQVKALLTQEMEGAGQFSVPLVAEAGAGHSWAQAKG